eukprot:4837984-Lingulodinium_polyedra.AAC.1
MLISAATYSARHVYNTCVCTCCVPGLGVQADDAAQGQSRLARHWAVPVPAGPAGQVLQRALQPHIPVAHLIVVMDGGEHLVLDEGPPDAVIAEHLAGLTALLLDAQALEPILDHLCRDAGEEGPHHGGHPFRHPLKVHLLQGLEDQEDCRPLQPAALGGSLRLGHIQCFGGPQTAPQHAQDLEGVPHQLRALVHQASQHPRAMGVKHQVPVPVASQGALKLEDPEDPFCLLLGNQVGVLLQEASRSSPGLTDDEAAPGQGGEGSLECPTSQEGCKEETTSHFAAPSEGALRVLATLDLGTVEGPHVAQQLKDDVGPAVDYRVQHHQEGGVEHVAALVAEGCCLASLLPHGLLPALRCRRWQLRHGQSNVLTALAQEPSTHAPEQHEEEPEVPPGPPVRMGIAPGVPPREREHRANVAK